MTAEQLRAEIVDIIDDLRTTPRDMRRAEYDTFVRSLLRLDEVAARLSGMAVAPEGWKLVPLLPTDGMLDAAQTNETGGLITREYRARIFRAMALAAPEPPHG